MRSTADGALFSQAKSLAAEGRPLEASVVMGELVARYPLEPRLLNYYGRLLLDAGLVSEAERVFTVSTELAPRSARQSVRSWTGLGDVLGQQGRLAEAEVCYGRALEIDESDITRVILGVLILRMGGRTEEAAQHFKGVLERQPSNAEALYNLALCVRGGSPAESLELLQRAVAADPKYLIARRELARLLIDVGHVVQGLRELRWCLVRDRNDSVCLRLCAEACDVMGNAKLGATFRARADRVDANRED